jgi:hypothetical protein
MFLDTLAEFDAYALNRSERVASITRCVSAGVIPATIMDSALLDWLPRQIAGLQSTMVDEAARTSSVHCYVNRLRQATFIIDGCEQLLLARNLLRRVTPELMAIVVEFDGGKWDRFKTYLLEHGWVNLATH